ncbi:EscJ/YscJ/HrcJ family type III secretion inner membrane ring protein [Candidatus Similichlamydia laticola]|uniref:Type III secretion bridge between inner and outermembrane lipoprotein (YscJ,HrcJ,EscJ,PscJ) n=1 Tax=Candidatus Similichlamydia laticola TaxID=2170265 RepID=A0A369KJ88_9BACT|nr:EscJ/YscJ/HrcJ family type III secretion inner membrane ring protein [Candidatus Similichlamydia laticola]RDB31843.1 Type III secretion bridge between inner and outermembrane lipoprotein (YscJ,HrcJ,EscJ,PscJ) [Candidatus Similichlamydia laticola]
MLKSFRAKISSFLSCIICSVLIGTTLPAQAGYFSGKNVIILTGLDEQETNEIVVILNGYGISSEKKFVAGSGASQASTWSLAVAANKKMDALALLNMRGLPRRRKTNTLLNLFSKQGLVSSDLAEKVRYQAGLADQIANTLRKLEGILDADVQLSIPSEENVQGSNIPEQKVTAAVYIKHTGILDDPNAYMQLKIKRLVSSSIPNLEPNNVTVIGDQAIIGNRHASDYLPEMVSVWGVKLDKSSARLFKIVVGLLIFFIGLFLAEHVWLVWKLQLLLSTQGLKKMLSVIPLKLEDMEEESGPTSTLADMNEKTPPEEEKANLDSEPGPKPPGPENSPKESQSPPQPGTDRLPPRR